MEHTIPAERAPTEACAGVSFVIVPIITLLYTLKHIPVTAAGALAEVRAAVRVQ